MGEHLDTSRLKPKVFCKIDTNDRFNFVSPECDFYWKNKDFPTQEELDFLRKGVDFNSCYIDGRNYMFLEDTKDGVTYNDKIVFSKDELLLFKCGIHYMSQDSDDDSLSSDSENNSESDDEDNFHKRNYIIMGTLYYDEELESVSKSKKHKCPCNNCLYFKNWYINFPKFIWVHMFVTTDKYKHELEPEDKYILKEDGIEFLEKDDIMHVGRQGAHVHLLIPYDESHYLLSNK